VRGGKLDPGRVQCEPGPEIGQFTAELDLINTMLPNQSHLSRREFLQRGSALAVAPLAATRVASEAIPALDDVIDTHSHFYDPTRPQGVPWPPENDPLLHRTVLPDEHRRIAAPHGVAGTVVVEASPWVEDNQWLLDLADREPWILGVVGQLEPGHEPFRQQLARFAAHPRFRGIRIGVWRQDHRLDDAAVRSDLERLIDADLSLDINCGHNRLDAVAQLAAALPNLRIIINHVANVRIDGQEPPSEWTRAIRAVARHANVHCKFSGLVEGTGRRGGEAPLDPAFYRPVVDVVWDAFGADRLVYGSNWPVSAHFAPYDRVQTLARDLLQSHGTEGMDKVFNRNPRRFYRLER
jgi:L-fuconolactonase